MNSRNIILLIAMLTLCLNAYSEIRYVDAKQLGVINKANKDSDGFSRVDTRLYKNLPQTVKQYLDFSTGVAVAFRTDSRIVSAKWTTRKCDDGANTTRVLREGLDLYILKDGEWTFAGIGTPSAGTRHESIIVKEMKDSMKYCLLYLPVMDIVDSLEIGVERKAFIEIPDRPLFEGKIAVIGSSITHGVAASRPGMTYPARIQRTLGMEVVNLGLAGLCRMEEWYNDIADGMIPDMFIIDSFSNPSAKEIEERLDRFVKRLRDTHPDVPILFLQTVDRESCVFDTGKREYEAQKRRSARAGMKRYLDGDDRKIFFMDPGMWLGEDHEGTVDGTHPTDLGFTRILEKLIPEIIKILDSEMS